MLYVGGMEYEGRLISIAMAERCGETLHVHIEKALYGYEASIPQRCRSSPAATRWTASGI